VPGPVLALDRAVKRYGPGAQVGPLTIAARAGETLALIGPSGAGKSTVLRLLLGLVSPDEGAVRLDGAPLRAGDPSVRRRFGYVIQGGGLFPEEALARFPSELSGGQAQRVGLMRALALDPDLLLLDEPLGALDPITRAELQDDLRRVFAELGKTVVLVTHDLAEAAFFSRRLVLLRDGRVAQEGTLEELARAPADAFVSSFVHAHRAVALPERA